MTERKVRVSGRGYGKTQAQREMAAQAALYQMVPINKALFESRANAEAAALEDRIAERAGYSSWEDYINTSLGSGWALQDSRYHARVLGRWQETPREELKRRLNLWARGTYPGLPINWKGLS